MFSLRIARGIFHGIVTMRLALVIEFFESWVPLRLCLPRRSGKLRKGITAREHTCEPPRLHSRCDKD